MNPLLVIFKKLDSLSMSYCNEMKFISQQSLSKHLFCFVPGIELFEGRNYVN